MLQPDRWRQIEAAYDAAIDLPVVERGPVLDRVCGNDRELRVQVEAMIAGTTTADDHLREVVGREASGFVEDQASPMIGRRLGPYRLVGELGRGGMGAVYRAERNDEYRTEVAIKLLQRGLETPNAVARFRDERQILATLEHPGIVRLLDGGATEDGLPYLVMEHVRGVPITHYVRDHDPPVPERVELFRAVCSAVQFAHQRLVVHRDLKPSNILVTADGVPKLLDFGIAKLLDDDASHEARTRTGMQLLTPEYASPEQARGEPVSVATDVYSLGAMLYELLTDQPAHRLGGASGLAALKVIIETPPPRPSTVAPADRRRAVAGDLDNIVLKALAKEPQHRYATVEQLSEDLRRHVEGLPVAARAGTWSYRAGKFIRRNLVLVAASLIVALALGAATAISIGQARRANAAAAEARDQADRAKRRFDDVRKLANTLLFDVDDGIKNLEGSTAIRELIVSHALGYLDGLAHEAGDNPELSRELAIAYMKIGDIQGSAREPNLGHTRDALASYHKAKDLIERLGSDDGTRWLRARVDAGIGDLHYQLDELDLATENLRAAVQIIVAMPHTAEFDHHVAVLAYLSLFAIASTRGDADAAAEHTQELVEVSERWVALVPSSAEARYWVGVASEARADAYELAADPDFAAEQARHAIEVFRALTAEYPSQASYRRELATALVRHAVFEAGSGNTHAWMAGVGDLPASEASLREAIQIYERLNERDRLDAREAAALAITLTSLAEIVVAHDDAEAIRLFERARKLYAELPQVARASTDVTYNEWYVPCAMGEALALAGRKADALAAVEEGTKLVAGSRDEELHVPACQYLAARAQRAIGDPAAARPLLEQTAAALRHELELKPTKVIARVGLVATLDQLAELRPADRCRFHAEALAVWEAWPGSPTKYTQRQLTARRMIACKSGS